MSLDGLGGNLAYLETGQAKKENPHIPDWQIDKLTKELSKEIEKR